MKTMQYYLTKLPKEFLDLEPRLKVAGRIEAVTEVSVDSSRSRRSGSVQGSNNSHGRQNDPEKRTATVSRGMKVAENWLNARGYSGEVRGKPFDLLATSGDDEVRVEVKSSIGAPTTVELTKNEVAVARDAGDDYRSLLIAVENIKLVRRKGKWVGSAGKVRVWWNWVPIAERLLPIRYEYVLPPICTRIQN